jgi:hypothetical protein
MQIYIGIQNSPYASLPDVCKRQFNSTRPALMGFSVILKNNPQKSKNDSSQKI